MKQGLLSERDMAFMDCIYLPSNSWIARDSNGTIRLHLCEDSEGIYIHMCEEDNIQLWMPKNDGESIHLKEELFQFITFDKPQRAEDLEMMYYDQKCELANKIKKMLQKEDEAEI